LTTVAAVPVAPRLVAVEAIRPGDRVVLPSGTRVAVEAVTANDDGTVTVRWWRDAQRGEPGFRNPDRERGDHNDGRYLGSLIAVPPGHHWRVEL
jgi:hypothetical protein